MIAEATMSLETAALGVTPNSRMRMGVMSAPPPDPVKPTSTPTMNPARTMCIRGATYLIIPVEMSVYISG
jgi:hypothetical protein